MAVCLTQTNVHEGHNKVMICVLVTASLLKAGSAPKVQAVKPA